MQTQLSAGERPARPLSPTRLRSVSRFFGSRFSGALTATALALCLLKSSAARAEGTPADLGTFLDLRDDYATRGDGGFVNAAVLRGDYAFNKGASLRLDVPLVYAGGLDTERSLGLGDVLVRPLVRVANAPTFALLLGADLVLDSAANAALGSGKNQVAPLLQAYFGVSRRFWVALALQHAVSFGGDPRRSDINHSVIRPFAILDLPGGFWLQPDQRFQIDYKGGLHVQSTTVLEVGKTLSDRVQVYVDPGVQVSRTGAVDWLVTGGIRWAFLPPERALVAAESPRAGAASPPRR